MVESVFICHANNPFSSYTASGSSSSLPSSTSSSSRPRAAHSRRPLRSSTARRPRLRSLDMVHTRPRSVRTTRRRPTLRRARCLTIESDVCSCVHVRYGCTIVFPFDSHDSHYCEKRMTCYCGYWSVVRTMYTLWDESNYHARLSAQ
jgi:hypothetical protein